MECLLKATKTKAKKSNPTGAEFDGARYQKILQK